MIPYLSGALGKEAEALARLRLGLTAVALEEFRADHDNRYPAALPELTPKFLSTSPEDPFDGQPMRYRTKGAGYTLYSVGPDLKDGGGAPMAGEAGDMVFMLVAPPKS
jgi:hypothetical protein